jgi:hypothetical protein
VLNLVSGITLYTYDAMTKDKNAESPSTDDVWITVESKRERKAKRLESCLNTGKTRNVSRTNGKEGFRVKFEDSMHSDSLILI